MISVVVPVYKNAENIEPLLIALDEVGRSVQSGLEVVFVVDGSPDASYHLLSKGIPSRQFRAQLLRLSRNFGSFAAIRAGLACASGEMFAVLAADLQEPPELIVEFERLLLTEECDIAIGERRKRADPLLTRLFSGAFWALYRRWVQPELPKGGVDVFGCCRQVRDELLRLDESNSSLIGLLFWVGFNRSLVPYDRRARQAGVSAWTFSRKLRYLSDSVFNFTDLPIRLLIRIGSLGVVSSLMGATIVLMSKFTGSITVPGYAATVLLIIFFGALNCFGIGVIGSYAWRTLENTKRRPNYIVSAHSVFDREDKRDVL
jgi:glycosyltransferase involved in cell wall biosynthesis